MRSFWCQLREREREREKRGDGGCNPLSQVQFICWTIQWLNLLAFAGVRYIENYLMSMEHRILWIRTEHTPPLNSVI